MATDSPPKSGFLTSEFSASLVPYALAFAASLDPVIGSIPGASPDVKAVCKAAVIIVGLVVGMIKGINYNNGRVELKKVAEQKAP